MGGTGKLSSPGGESRMPGIGVLVALVCISIVLVTLYSREGANGPVHVLRSVVQVVETPFEWVGSQLVRPFDALGRIVHNATADGAALSDLEERNAYLTAQLAELNEYRLENERLEQMLGLVNAYGMRGIGARVIGGSSSDWDATIVIDKGTSSGVSVDMPVMGYGSVIGQVTEASAFSSTVTLLADPTSGVSALLQGTREVGILEGSVDGALHLSYIPTSVSVTVGEPVVTSGLGGVYPSGMLLGTVASVSNNASDMYHTIIVAPAAQVSNYEEVFVMTTFDAERVAAQQASASGDGDGTDEVQQEGGQ